jgi:putative transposase
MFRYYSKSQTRKLDVGHPICYTENVELYHVCNRGVEKRTVFLDDSDRLRFIHDLFAFNDIDSAANYLQPGRHTEHSRDFLVHLHAYVLMTNHYHLLVSEAVESGISLFIKKLNGGYAKYFNERYRRSGSLWQGKYRRIHVNRDAHFLYIPHYIHLNPLDLTHPEWRSGKVKNVSGAISALQKYRWSSHLDYTGYKNFPSVISMNLLRDVFGSPERYVKELRSVIASPSAASASHIIEIR